MQTIKSFVADFKNRGGIMVTLSSIFLKLCGLFISIFIVRFIPKAAFGNIAFAMSFIGIVSVFGGLGSNWSLLRFGALLESYSQKFSMFKFSIKNGTIFNIFLFGILVVVSFFLPKNVEKAQVYLIVLALGLFTKFLFESLLSYFRIMNKNGIYSKSNTYSSLLLVAFTCGLTYLFSGVGYTVAIVVTPLCSFLLFRKHILFRKNRRASFSVPKGEYYRYGIYTGFGMVANQLIISSGGMLAGFLGANNSDIAMFKVATIIPFNLMFIPVMVMTTDFVHFSKNQDKSQILLDYYWNYLKTITMICLVPFAVFVLFNREFITLLFGRKYMDVANMSIYLTIAIFFSFLFRIPLGNMLSAVGKANWNVVHSVIWLILFIPLTTVLFHHFGIEGIAMSISFVIIASGFVSLILFYKYLSIIKG